MVHTADTSEHTGIRLDQGAEKGRSYGCVVLRCIQKSALPHLCQTPFCMLHLI